MNDQRALHLISLLAIASSGCAKSNPAYSGETHFLGVCSDDDACGAGLSCICGVCTLACAGDGECRAQHPAASCGGPGTPRGICEPESAPAACGAACGETADCAALGAGYACVHRECRLDAAGSCTLAASLYPDGADDIPALDGCNRCFCRAGELGCTTSDCATSSSDGGALDASGTLVTLRGTLVPDASLGFDRGALRMALVWYPAALDAPLGPELMPSAPCASLDVSYHGLVAQELELGSAFMAQLLRPGGDSMPLAFAVDVLEPPPAEALRPVPDGAPGRWTVGKLLVYEDRDGDGRFGTSTLAARTQDVVLGASSDWSAAVGQPQSVRAFYEIYYSEVRISSPVIEPGFSILLIENDEQAGYPSTMVGADQPIQIDMRASPRVQTLNCEELCMVGDMSFGCPIDAAELPGDGSVECIGAADMLAWWRVTCDGCTCTNVSCSLARTFTASAADWPCR